MSWNTIRHLITIDQTNSISRKNRVKITMPPNAVLAAIISNASNVL